MFYGVVEDRHDPLKIGRVRVRIHGYHTHDKQMISTPDLPWCQVILPTTSTGHSGFGSQHGLTEGTNVIGFFRDKAMQDPVITGVVAGISSKFSRIEGEKNIEPKVDDGFNDPRRLKKSDYSNTPDGENPKHSSIRGFGLEGSLEHAPKLPKKVEVTYEAKGSTLENPTLSDSDLPYYPLERSNDLHKAHLGDHNYDLRKIPLDGFLDSPAQPKYPYNKTLFTESGHFLEIDDTFEKERLAIEHRSGTFYEIHPDGSEVHRVVNDHYQVVCKDDKIYIAGNADLTVEKGNVTINVNTGNVDMKVLKGNVTSEITEGNLKADILKGTTDILSEGKITITGNSGTEIISDTKISGTLHVTKAQTNDSTITASGEITAKTEAGSVKLTNHTHTVGGSASPATGKPIVS